MPLSAETVESFLARMIIATREGDEVTADDLNQLDRVAAGQPYVVHHDPEPPTSAETR
jgi:hypothetical protein